MTIETKKNANGKISAYYIDGVKVRKGEVEYYACNPAYNGVIEVDYCTARYNLPKIYKCGKAVVFKNWVDGSDVMTKVAAERLGLKVGRKISMFPAIYRVEKDTEVKDEFVIVPETDGTEEAREEIMSTPLVTEEAMEEAYIGEVMNAYDAEIEAANVATENAEFDANEEIINCTNEIIISDAAYRQMIDTELYNAARAAGNYVLTINGERVIFENHKIVRIDAKSKYGLNMRVVNGRKQFRRYNYVIARATVAKMYMDSELAAVQEKKFREFFIKDGAAKKGFFAVKVYVTFDDGREHIYANYFDRWDEAKAYVETVKEFVGNVQCEIYIQRDEQCGKMYYHRDAQGTETYDLPNTDFFKGTPAPEIQARIDELKKAKADNEQYKDNSDGYVWTELCVANAAIDKTIEYYEFILHENKDTTAAKVSETAMFETRETDGTEYKYYIKSRRPIYGAAPSGYIKAVSGEVHEPVRRPNGTYSPKCRIYFATVIYDKPLTDEQILNYDLAVSNETFEKLNAKEEPIIANISVKETDGTEEDADDTNEAFNLLPSVDELNDVEISAIDTNGETLTEETTTEEKTADDFADELARRKAEQIAALDAVEQARLALYNAQKAYDKASAAYEKFGEAKAKEISQRRLPPAGISAKITVVTQDGRILDKPDLKRLRIDFLPDGPSFEISVGWDCLGNYKSPAHVETVITKLKAAVGRGDKDFPFPKLHLTEPPHD